MADQWSEPWLGPEDAFYRWNRTNRALASSMGGYDCQFTESDFSLVFVVVILHTCTASHTIRYSSRSEQHGDVAMGVASPRKSRAKRGGPEPFIFAGHARRDKSAR